MIFKQLVTQYKYLNYGFFLPVKSWKSEDNISCVSSVESSLFSLRFCQLNTSNNPFVYSKEILTRACRKRGIQLDMVAFRGNKKVRSHDLAHTN